MGYLLPALTRERFETQRDVVLNERRQNYENRPYGLAHDGDHGGAVSARSSVSLDDDRRRPTTFARCSSTTCRRSSAPTTIRPTRRWCWPATSTPTRAFELAEQLLRRPAAGHASAAGASPPRRWRASSGSCSRIASSCRGSTWRGISPAMFAADDAELDLRGGSAGQRQDVAALSDARLRAAHRARRLRASAVRASWAVSSCWRPPRRPGSRWPRSRRVIDAELERVLGRRARPTTRWSAALRPGRGALHVPPADGRRLRRQVRSAERLQRAARRSRLLRRRTSRATAARRTRAVRAAAAPYLRRDARVVLSIVPRGQPALALRRLRAGVGVVMAVDRSASSRRRARPGVRVPDDRAAPLANGLEVRTVEHRSVPVVTLRAAGRGRFRRRSARTERAWRRSSPTWWTRAPARSAPSTCPTPWRASAPTTTSTSAPTSTVVLADDAGAVRRSRRRRCSPT